MYIYQYGVQDVHFLSTTCRMVRNAPRTIWSVAPLFWPVNTVIWSMTWPLLKEICCVVVVIVTVTVTIYRHRYCSNSGVMGEVIGVLVVLVLARVLVVLVVIVVIISRVSCAGCTHPLKKFSSTTSTKPTIGPRLSNQQQVFKAFLHTLLLLGHFITETECYLLSRLGNNNGWCPGAGYSWPRAKGDTGKVCRLRRRRGELGALDEARAGLRCMRTSLRTIGTTSRLVTHAQTCHVSTLQHGWVAHWAPIKRHSQLKPTRAKLQNQNKLKTWLELGVPLDRGGINEILHLDFQAIL